MNGAAFAAARRATNMEHLLLRHTGAPLCLQLSDGGAEPTVAALALRGPAGPVDVRLALSPGDGDRPLAAALLLAALYAGVDWEAVPGTLNVRRAVLPLGHVRQALATAAGDEPALQAAIVTREAALWLF